MSAVMQSTSYQEEDEELKPCLSCLVGFYKLEDLKAHYRSDLHRYNMKRKIAGLPTVRQDVFEQRQASLAATAQGSSGSDAGGGGSAAAATTRPRCEGCGKSFGSANAYNTHISSKKHKESVAKTASTSKLPIASTSTTQYQDGPLRFPISAAAASALTAQSGPQESVEELKAELPNTVGASSASTDSQGAAQSAQMDDAASSSEPSRNAEAPTSLLVPADATDAQVEEAIAARLASATRVNPSKQCIFCPTGTTAVTFDDLDASLDHMQRFHGFFLPERPYIADLPGLAQYLADKVHVGHMCLYCSERGRGFKTSEAARKHMLDKNHCKVAYDREEDRLELGDFYDFRSSYPDYKEGEGDEVDAVEEGDEDGDEGWEDEDMEDGEEEKPEAEEEEEEDLAPNGLRYGDNEYELVLPSGARLGHRSLARYYRQTLFTTPATAATSNRGGGALARRLIDQARPGSDLIVADRNGGEVKARNRGEAREAKRHVKEFRDMKRRENFKTDIGYRNNSQKHFRDPLLQ